MGLYAAHIGRRHARQEMMHMSNPPEPRHETSFEKARAWLTSEVSLTLPGWAFASAGAVALLLLLVALD
jgi:hypothetical protein